jgi:hypothetical protein
VLKVLIDKEHHSPSVLVSVRPIYLVAGHHESALCIEFGLANRCHVNLVYVKKVLVFLVRWNWRSTA